MVIEFSVNGAPVATPRPKVSTRGGIGRAYTPAKHAIHAYKKAIELVAKTVHSGPAIDSPVRVDVEAVFPRTLAEKKGKKPKPRKRHTKKPDRDNIDKGVLDALVNAGVLTDDSIVCEGSISKWIAAGDETPHTRIRIEILR